MKGRLLLYTGAWGAGLLCVRVLIVDWMGGSAYIQDIAAMFIFSVVLSGSAGNGLLIQANDEVAKLCFRCTQSSSRPAPP